MALSSWTIPLDPTGLYYFSSFAIAWIISIVIKSILKAHTQKKSLNILDGLHNGGMPSSHSTVVSAITAAIFFTEGLSALFAVSLVFALIVISDAFMFRYNVGIQGDAMNVLLKKAKQKQIPVVYGHTLFQVIMGILLGVVVAGVLFLFM